MTEQNTPLQWPVTQLKQMTPIASITPTHANCPATGDPRAAGLTTGKQRTCRRWGCSGRRPPSGRS